MAMFCAGLTLLLSGCAANDSPDIGNARIAGLEKDLNLSSRQYEWLLWAFYITYIAFEWMTLMYVFSISASLNCVFYSQVCLGTLG